MLPELAARQPDDHALVQIWGERFLGIFPDRRHDWRLALQLAGGSLGAQSGDGAHDPVLLRLLGASPHSRRRSGRWARCGFLVAMGVGGEWAVGAALVAEVFSKGGAGRAGGHFPRDERDRPLARGRRGTRRGLAIGAAYMLGVIPALLVLWVRMSISEPAELAGGESKRKPSGWAASASCLANPQWRRRADVRRAARDGGARDILGSRGRGAESRRRPSETPR